MALSFATGVLTAGTTDTTDSVTGLGFQPKFVIFRATNLAGETAEQFNALSGGMGVGFSDGTNHRVVGFYADNNSADSNTQRVNDEANCIFIDINGNPGAGLSATCAMDAGGFTLTWSTTPAAAYKIMWEAYGGSDITNVAIGTAVRSAATGTIDTNVGFVGNWAMFLCANSNLTSEAVADLQHSVGFATDSTHECAAAIAVQDAQAMATGFNALGIVRDDACLVGLTVAGAVDFVADFTTFDQGAAGTTFRVNFSDGPAAQIRFHYLVVKGGTWNVGVSQAPAAAGAQTVSGLAVQPSTLGLVATDCTALNTITAHASMCAGAADGTNESSVGFFHSDTADPTVVEQFYATTRCMVTRITSGPEADFTSFNSDGWTITWVGTVGSKQVLWYAAAGAGGTTHNAAASLAAVASLTAAASLTANAAAALNSVATLTPFGGLRHDAAASLQAVATLTPGGALVQIGAAQLTALASLTAAPLLTLNGAALLAALATLTPNATATYAGAASLGAVATLTPTASVLISGAAALNALASLTVAGALAQIGAASLSSLASLAADAQMTRQATALLAAVAALTPTASVQFAGAVLLEATAFLTPSGLLILQGAVAVAAIATLTANGEVVAAPVATVLGLVAPPVGLAAYRNAPQSGGGSWTQTPPGGGGGAGRVPPAGR